jgi:hypothetical protein
MVTALESTEVLEKLSKVWKESCHGKAETVVDAEGAERWLR